MDWTVFLSATVPQLQHAAEYLQACQLKAHAQTWRSFTSDQYILNSIQGYEIEFLYKPVQFCAPTTLSFTTSEQEAQGH